MDQESKKTKHEMIKTQAVLLNTAAISHRVCKVRCLADAGLSLFGPSICHSPVQGDYCYVVVKGSHFAQSSSVDT
uniref:Uncharacterized protein n=1 Tax=Anguilla anguilla TaxID=7936 RepID=A0A0E9WUK4_ANGAN